LTKGRSRAALLRKPAHAKWSVAEILAHLADAELAFGWRLRSMLASPGVSLQWSDEYLWSERCDYLRVPAADSLATFSALRASNLALVRRVPRALHEAAYGVHDKRGRQTVREFVVMEAAHDLNHLLQVRQLLRESPATRPARLRRSDERRHTGVGR
jgi:hypothetical protein